jgi:hypothetical protein
LITTAQKKYTLLAIALSLVLLGAAALFWFLKKPQQVQSIAASGGAAEATYQLSESAFFLQTDGRWSKDEIGGSRESLGAVGCAICSVSMALAHHGIEMPPGQLNEKLKTKEGYTEQGWLKWNKITELTDRRIRIEIPERLTHEAIDLALKAKQPVIAKVFLNRFITHWVLIVGKSGLEYLIKDPLGDGRSLDRLSKFGSDIYAIRIVTKVNA